MAGLKTKSTNQLLLSEPPLQVIPSLGVVLGLNPSIVVQQLHFWLENPRAGVVIDGKKWIYNTYEEWKEGNFPFWSVPTIQRHFSSLEKDKLVVSAQFDKAAYDRGKYYRIDYEELQAAIDRAYQNDTFEGPKVKRRAYQFGKFEGRKVMRSLNVSESQSENPENTTVPEDNLAWLSNMYSNTIGMIPNLKVADEIKEYSLLPLAWLQYGFSELANAKKPIMGKWAYVRTCIDTCRKLGKVPPPPATPTAGPKRVVNAQAALAEYGAQNYGDPNGN